MLKIIVITAMLVPAISFAKGRGPFGNKEAAAALKACGIERPEKGTRPGKAFRNKVHECLDAAGIEKPSKRKRGRGNQSDD